jgi:endonuclease/exonuclease/phosphatase family metal-dependent hydrolase
VPRGYLWAEVDLNGTRITFLTTHLHHILDQPEVRQAQVIALLDAWNGKPKTLLLGDLNAEPGTEEMALLAQAGFIDSWEEAGTGEGSTIPAIRPSVRVDWIWHTPDLGALDAIAVSTTASDHLPVIALIDLSTH